MPRKPSKSSSFITILILVAAVALWISDAYKRGNLGSFFERAAPRQSSAVSSELTRTGGYDTYPNCTLVSDRGNDGDSFKVRFPDGRSEILRLYFVDTPESAFKTYGGGRNNHKRIADQAADLAGISSKQAVEIGKKAKNFTLTLLDKGAFTVHTEWDSPFNDGRYHAYIEISAGTTSRFLNELLVEKGFARIHTKGANLPDGTSERAHEKYLFNLQRTAKLSQTGAWGL
jgi:endonuclease YncB( thermonuclease family)